MKDNFDVMSQMTYDQKREYEEQAKMNKKLSPLEALKDLKVNGWFDNRGRNDIDIIETALKRLEELEKAFDSLIKDDEKAKKLLSLEIEKNRAFEIIEEKRVRMSCLMRALEEKWSYEKLVENHKMYCISLNMLTKEEYELLKEVFCISE